MKINAAIFFIMSILHLSAINIFLDILSLPIFDRLYSYTFGGILLILGIFSLLVSYRDNMIQSRLLFELIIACEIAIVFTSFTALHIMSSSYMPPPTVIVWLTNIIFIGLIVLNTIVYRKTR